MSTPTDQYDDVIARLRAQAPGIPPTGPDAAATLARSRRRLRNLRVRQVAGGVAGGVAAVLVAGIAVGPIDLPGGGTFVMPGGYEVRELAGEPPVHSREQMREDVAALEAEVVPVVEDVELSLYLEEFNGPIAGTQPCHVLETARGTFRTPDDKSEGCSNPDENFPFDAVAQAQFDGIKAALARTGTNIHRITDRQGAEPTGLHFQLDDVSWLWNWDYVYQPEGIPQDGTVERALGTTTYTHITGDWWFMQEPDD
jgi:hypothetical protein